MKSRKKVAAVQNPRTGSYTVHIPKSAITGKFLSEARKPGRIVVLASKKKTA